MLDHSCPIQGLGNGSRGAATKVSAGRQPQGPREIKEDSSPGGATENNAPAVLNNDAEQSAAPPGLDFLFRSFFPGLAPRAIS